MGFPKNNLPKILCQKALSKIPQKAPVIFERFSTGFLKKPFTAVLKPLPEFLKDFGTYLVGEFALGDSRFKDFPSF